MGAAGGSERLLELFGGEVAVQQLAEAHQKAGLPKRSPQAVAAEAGARLVATSPPWRAVRLVQQLGKSPLLVRAARTRIQEGCLTELLSVVLAGHQERAHGLLRAADLEPEGPSRSRRR
jgi:hypothetical protein